ncbi:hypothetical protein FGO68_gene11054 [Halteria grandinella]|uniref:Uncharacterized protein n=1 Tax=Halteria grandinella TaxID=5974 RepID=A0A8J8P0P8_HALGN|nr:hypothetical protein FGO68_gene11054 [Halteria grandinella]
MKSTTSLERATKNLKKIEKKVGITKTIEAKRRLTKQSEQTLTPRGVSKILDSNPVDSIAHSYRSVLKSPMNYSQQNLLGTGDKINYTSVVLHTGQANKSSPLGIKPLSLTRKHNFIASCKMKSD